MHAFREASIKLMRLEVGNTGHNAGPTFKYKPLNKKKHRICIELRLC